MDHLNEGFLPCTDAIHADHSLAKEKFPTNLISNWCAGCLALLSRELNYWSSNSLERTVQMLCRYSCAPRDFVYLPAAASADRFPFEFGCRYMASNRRSEGLTWRVSALSFLSYCQWPHSTSSTHPSLDYRSLIKAIPHPWGIMGEIPVFLLR